MFSKVDSNQKALSMLVGGVVLAVVAAIVALVGARAGVLALQGEGAALVAGEAVPWIVVVGLAATLVAGCGCR